MNLLDKLILELSPQRGLARIRARAVAKVVERHYDAAATGRRTSGWPRQHGDANAIVGPSLSVMRAHARDLVRNNPWARRGLRVIANNTVGWGIRAKPVGAGVRTLNRARDVWARWADTTACDFEGQHTLTGLMHLGMETTGEAGEVLVRRRWVTDGPRGALPMQLQVLEPDFIDTSKDGINGQAGGPIVHGVEYDKAGRRVAYWLYDKHPGGNNLWSTSFESKRVAATDILHMYRVERPGQVRGITWFAPIILRLKDLDEYEDATLMRQKIAACFAVFVTDVDGNSSALGTGPDDPERPLVDTLEPGMVEYLPVGKDVKFTDVPSVSEHGSFTKTELRGAAMGLGVTYEDMTGDYSDSNFSSARMSRLSHWANVHDWRWNMLIPQFCDRVWAWAMETAVVSGQLAEMPRAEWTPPAMPMVEPDREGLAYMRNVRTGLMTHDQMAMEQGYDPDVFWQQYADGVKRLRELGLVLDSDAGLTTQAGNPRETAVKAEKPENIGNEKE